MLNISGTTITMTRGDTARIACALWVDSYHTLSYEAEEGDILIFAVKESLDSTVDPIFAVDIPLNTMLLHIIPEYTNNMTAGTYVYGIQLVKANGDVETLVECGTLKLVEGVISTPCLLV